MPTRKAFSSSNYSRLVNHPGICLQLITGLGSRIDSTISRRYCQPVNSNPIGLIRLIQTFVVFASTEAAVTKNSTGLDMSALTSERQIRLH